LLTKEPLSPGDIIHPVVTRAAVEEISKHQRRQRGVASGTATPDDDAVVIDQTLCNEEIGTIDTVIGIDDAPVQVQAIAKGAAEAGSAPQLTSSPTLKSGDIVTIDRLCMREPVGTFSGAAFGYNFLAIRGWNPSVGGLAKKRFQLN
jgi:hypothetical protein